MTAAKIVTLPEAFADLERFSKWCIETEAERYETRLASTLAEMQELYDAMLPRLADAMEYCSRFPLDELPDDARQLMYLIFSLIEASFPVEVWKQPRVPASGATAITCVHEPAL